MKKIFLPFKGLRPGKKTISILISILVCILVITIYNLEDRDIFKPLRIFRAMEQKSLDLRFQIRGKRDTGNEIVIVAIDEKSIKKIGRYPWPRNYIAQFVEKIADTGARVLALDVIYSEPQNYDILGTLDNLAKSYNDLSLWYNLPELTGKEELMSVLQKEKERLDQDSKLKDAFRKAVIDNGVDIISAIRFVDAGERRRSDFTGKELSAVGRELLKESAYFPVLVGEEKKAKKMDSHNNKLTVLTAKNRKEIMNNLLAEYQPKKAVGVINLIDPFAEYVTYQGFVDTHVDYSGIVRSEYLAIQFEDEFYPPLGVQAARIYKGIEYGEMKLWLTKKLLFKETEVPIDSWNRMIINYCGPGYTFKHYSFCDVIDGKIPSTAFSDKIVYLGATAPGLTDFIATPFSSQTSGVEKHATVTENILHSKFLVRGKGEVFHDIMAILCISLAMGIFLSLLPSVWGGVASALLWFGYSFYVYMTFVNDGIWLNIAYPSITVITCFSSITLYLFISEEKKRKEVKLAFERHVSHSVVAEIIKNPDMLHLGGQKKTLTIFFTDIGDFTSLSDILLPEEIVNHLNHYFRGMCTAILEYNGTINEFLGDAILAFWGAPIAQEDHALLACQAALRCREFLGDLERKWVAEGLPPRTYRFGINTGDVVVGNVGSPSRFKYMAVGEDVYLASRLEGANKYYGTQILISEKTYSLIKDMFIVRDIDIIRVVGKSKPVKVYELVSKKGQIDERKSKQLGHFEAGVRAYRARQWEVAISCFKHVLHLEPEDGPTKMYVQRCQGYQQMEPAQDWDGVYNLTAK